MDENTTLQDLRDESEKVSKVLTEVSDGLKEIKEKVNEWSNFQLKEPVDIYTKRIISDQITIPISTIYLGTTPATSTNFNNYFIADRSYIIEAITITYGTASTSGTFKVVKTVSGTAVASGSDVMTTTLSMSATANINYSASLINGDVINLKQGDRLGIIVGGTLTNLANLLVQTKLRQI